MKCTSEATGEPIGEPSACYSEAPSSFSVVRRFLAQVPRLCGWLWLRLARSWLGPHLLECTSPLHLGLVAMGELSRRRSRTPRRNVVPSNADISPFVPSNAEVQQGILGDSGRNGGEQQDDSDGESNSSCNSGSFYTQSDEEAEEVPASPEVVPSPTPTAELEAHHGYKSYKA